MVKTCRVNFGESPSVSIFMKKLALGHILFGMVLMFSHTVAQAASFTWDGGGAGVHISDWTKKANWGNTSTPGAADTAIFTNVVGSSSTPLINSASAISDIVYNANAAAFTLGGSAILTINNGIANNGTASQTINTALALSGAQTWNANSGSLAIGGTVNNGGFGLTVGGANNTTISGIVTGAGALNKSGNGTLTLSQANTFTGGMAINGGNVRVSNTTGSATGSGNVVLNSGSFGGLGRITGGLTINSGRISPGNDGGSQRVGTLTTGSETWNGGGMNFSLKDAASTAGVGWDLLSINGTLNLSGLSAGNPFTIDLLTVLGNGAGNASNFDPNQNYQWLVATTTGGVSGFNANAFTFTTNGFSNPLLGTSQFMMSLVDGGNGLAITYVPEPSTIALGVIGAAMIAGRSIRRRKK